jgi:hypothetical protein
MKSLLLSLDIEESKKDTKNTFKNTTALQLLKMIAHQIHKVLKYIISFIIGLSIKVFKFTKNRRED